jgi:2-amino-4-hydroxy-6-hydroxymethyldihydropteridine diphosphokinase
MDRLQELSNQPLVRSSLWETAPVNCPPNSPNFVNAAVALVPMPDETPEVLLAKLQALEKEFGRVPKKSHNEARSLDLDLIAFGNETRQSSFLILPHPRAIERRFVLQPLSEVAPDFLLPGQTHTIAQLLRTLKTDEKLKPLD